MSSTHWGNCILRSTVSWGQAWRSSEKRKGHRTVDLIEKSKLSQPNLLTTALYHSTPLSQIMSLMWKSNPQLRHGHFSGLPVSYSLNLFHFKSNSFTLLQQNYAAEKGTTELTSQSLSNSCFILHLRETPTPSNKELFASTSRDYS